MRTTILAFAAATLLTGTAFAQAVDTGTAAGNTKEYNGCGVPPCVQGPPTAAGGGTGGSGPGALRTAPSDSPVALGAGGNNGGTGEGGASGGGKTAGTAK